MAERKPRAKAKEQPKSKPLLQLDPDRWEEIAAIVTWILAAFTALGAFNLSGGFLLTSWVQFLQMLLGWGVYFTPVFLFLLGLWLILDALDKTWNIGWERPIGIAFGYLATLAIMQFVSALANPIAEPGPFKGGGLVGWGIVFALVQAFGVIGAALIILAVLSIGLILVFNISLPELARRIVYILQLIPNLPREIGRIGKKEPEIAPNLPAWTTVPDNGREQSVSRRGQSARSQALPAPDAARSAPIPLAPPPQAEPGTDEPAKLKSPLAARIIGSESTGRAPGSGPIIQREWNLPDVGEMLEESTEQEFSQQEIRDRVHKIEETLAHFGVPARVIEVNQGPTITQFGVEPGFIEQKGTEGKVHRVKVKVSRISALQHDLELALAAAPIRIEAPVPGRSVVGIEVPNSSIGMVSLRSILESEAFGKIKSKLRIALGQDVAGQPICADLTTMPHLLIAGATGSGKSVCINAIIAALLCTTKPNEVQFIMVDPKRVELVNYRGIPHLVQDVVTDVDGAVAALQFAVEEMDRRFQEFATKSVRNIEIYNRMVEDKPEQRMPYLLVIVDELADLMMVAANQVEHSITRLAQMARATGIHLILATQRPSVDVVTGLIKANFPARISFAVTSQIDSRVVLDTPGAEKLLGRGDMLYMASDSSKLLRLQGCFVSDRELDKLIGHWKRFAPTSEPTSLPRGPGRETETANPTDALKQTTFLETDAPGEQGESTEDDLLPEAIEIVTANKRASISLLQRKLRIGYSRAAHLVELLEKKGIVGPDEGPTKGRAVIPLERPATNSTPGASITKGNPTGAPGAASKSGAASRNTSARPRADRRESSNGLDFSDFTEKDFDDLDKE